MTAISYAWRGPIDNAAVNALHAEAFQNDGFDDDWKGMVDRHSLGWVTAHDVGGLVGFVNVPWDGGMHAWIQDVMVAVRSRHQGVGTRLVEVAVEQARAAGCEWIHADFDDELRGFYFDACGFVATTAGLIRL